MNHVTAIVFDGKRTAGQAFDKLDESGAIDWIDDVAVVSRSKHGFIRMNSTWAQDDTALAGGIGLGTMTGALLGAMMGPQGAIASAVGAGALAGGSIGSLFGLGAEVVLDDPRLDEFASKLEKDTSALVLVSDESRSTEFVDAFAPFEGTVIRTEVNEHDIKALEEAMKAARERAN